MVQGDSLAKLFLIFDIHSFLALPYQHHLLWPPLWSRRIFHVLSNFSYSKNKFNGSWNHCQSADYSAPDRTKATELASLPGQQLSGACLMGCHLELFYAYDTSSLFQIMSTFPARHHSWKMHQSQHPVFVWPVWITEHFQRHVPSKMDVFFCMIWTIILAFPRAWAETFFNPKTLGIGTTFAISPRSIMGSKF